LQYVRIAMYEIRDGIPEDLRTRTHEGLLRMFREQSGYLRDHLVPLSDRRYVSITFWDSKEAANSAIGVADGWVRETVAEKVAPGSTTLRVIAPSDDEPAAI
jgi:hypothetical protein